VIVTPKVRHLVAHQVTEASAVAVAAWCHGGVEASTSFMGEYPTKTHPRPNYFQRFNAKTQVIVVTDIGDVAEIGDWVIHDSPLFYVVDRHEFEDRFDIWCSDMVPPASDRVAAKRKKAPKPPRPPITPPRGGHAREGRK